MLHNYGNEYRIKIVREDGIEKLSGWMNSIEEVAQGMITVQKPQGSTCWLQVRSIFFPNSSGREQMWEYPIMHIPSPRFIPRDSRYLQVMESRIQYSRNWH